MRATIVIPAYNEETRIGQTLHDYLEYYRDKPVEFLVVLNGCRDNTRGVVQSFIDKQSDKVRCVEIPKASKGLAIRHGFSLAQGELIAFLDADGSTSPQEFQKLITRMDGVDGAIASRWKRGSIVIGRNNVRKIVSFGFIVLVRLLFLMPFVDTQCGAKIFTRAVVKRLLPLLSVNNMAFDVELLYRAIRSGFKIVEVPTRWVDKSSSSMLGSPWKIIRTSVNMFSTLLSIRFKRISYAKL